MYKSCLLLQADACQCFAHILKETTATSELPHGQPEQQFATLNVSLATSAWKWRQDKELCSMATYLDVPPLGVEEDMCIGHQQRRVHQGLNRQLCMQSKPLLHLP